MKLIGTLKRNFSYKLIALDATDRVSILPSPYGAQLFLRDEQGHEVAGTDKVNYQALGGVMFLGGPGSGPSLFVNDPRWVAGLMCALEKLDGSNPPTQELLVRPVSSLEAAVKKIQAMHPGYRWMLRYRAYGVPGYDRGPEAWEMLTEENA